LFGGKLKDVMYNDKNTVSVVLECTECKNTQEIRRKKSNLKKVGHKKHIYCVKCKKITLHLDMGPIE
jgi:ribosomal protein L33